METFMPTLHCREAVDRITPQTLCRPSIAIRICPVAEGSVIRLPEGLHKNLLMKVFRVAEAADYLCKQRGRSFDLRRSGAENVTYEKSPS
jgi:hypothetical protein